MRGPTDLFNVTPIGTDRTRLRAAFGTISGPWFTRNQLAMLGQTDDGFC